MAALPYIPVDIAFHDMPLDLVVEILARLPAEFVVLYSFLTRELYSIIRSRYFISLHFNLQKAKSIFRRHHANQDQYWLLDVAENKPFTINSSIRHVPPFVSQYDFFYIVGSCRGIVCLADIVIADRKQPIFLWNPCIRKHLRLPFARIGDCRPHFFALGFGYSDYDDDPKVVRFVTFGKTADGSAFVHPEAEIVSIKNPGWETVPVDIRLRNVRFAWSPVFLHGVVHWLAYTSQNDRYRISVMRFRVAEEDFDEMQPPSELKLGNYKTMSLTLMGESLAVINYKTRTIFDVWLMQRYDDILSWNKLYSCRTETGNPRVVALRQNKEALTAYNMFGLYALDLENWGTTSLRISGATGSFHVAEYVESLELQHVRVE